ncbi:hypothetical protein JCM19233_2473 [Vibrio astriarenae]|nr:hypothetical protein JCM19233_2473 [Vibrio sp. C7]
MLLARVDLRIPINGMNSDNTLERDVPTCFVNISVELIKRFMASLNAQIATDQMNKARKGDRVYPCPLNYIWVRERNTSHNEHYHVVIMVNQNSYYPFGRLHHEETLAYMVQKAWASALGISVEESDGLVQIPANPMYTLNINHPPAKFQEDLNNLAIRLGYLAKERTKIHGDGRRNFGCSNPRKG